jgi:hypothetical protein
MNDPTNGAWNGARPTLQLELICVNRTISMSSLDVRAR